MFKNIIILVNKYKGLIWKSYFPLAKIFFYFCQIFKGSFVGVGELKFKIQYLINIETFFL